MRYPKALRSLSSLALLLSCSHALLLCYRDDVAGQELPGLYRRLRAVDVERQVHCPAYLHANLISESSRAAHLTGTLDLT
jgi:hypothetical protein